MHTSRGGRPRADATAALLAMALDRSGRAVHYVALDRSGDAPAALQLQRSTALLGIVMPLHAPKLTHAQRFLTSLQSCSVERIGWFPTFSSLADLHLAANASILTHPNVDTALAIVAKPARINPITSKKWLALRYVFASSPIPFAFALDAETVFASRAPASALLNWLQRASAIPRLVFGTAEFANPKWWPPVYSGRPVLRATRESCALLGLSDVEARQLNSTGVLDHYWWFHDAPLYERLPFLAFWERLRWRPSRDASLSWYAFDHVAYECHQLLLGSSRLVSVDSILPATSRVRSNGFGDLCCGVEIASIPEQEQLAAASGHTFLWSHAAMVARVPRAHAPRRLFVYHLDRCEDGGACRPAHRERLKAALASCVDGQAELPAPRKHQAEMRAVAAETRGATRAQAVAGNAPERAAVLTLVADGGGWLEGARVLACSMPSPSELGPGWSFELVALCFNVSDSAALAAGWRCVRPDPIPNPYASGAHLNARKLRRGGRPHPWPWDYTLKIAPFAMLEYDRVVVIDADALVVRPEALLSLLTRPIPRRNILASRDCAAMFVRRVLGGLDAEELQGGVFVGRPSQDTYAQLVSAAAVTPSVDQSGQGFFTNFWRGRVEWLPASFNYQCVSRCVAYHDLHDGASGYDGHMLNRSMLPSRRQVEEIAERHLRDGRVGIAHFHFAPKPWTCSTDKLRACGVGSEAGTTRVDALHAAWFERAARCNSGRRQAGSGVSVASTALHGDGGASVGQGRAVRLCHDGEVSGAEEGAWSHSAVDGYSYEPSTCRLARPSAASARACLRGRHVLFSGDSISRYLYLSLASFLVSGAWPDDAPLLEGRPSVCHERSFYRGGMPTGKQAEQYPQWRAYFNTTSATLDGHELCDCYRAGCCGPNELTENRYTSVDGARLSFATQVGGYDWPLHGHVAGGSFESMRDGLRCSPGDCRGRPAWRLKWPEYLRRNELNVSDLVLNAGHHWSLAKAPDGFASSLFTAAAGAAAPSSGSTGAGRRRGAWWRTTTATVRHALTSTGRRRVDGLALDGQPLRQPAAEAAARDAGVGIFDALAVTERLGRDTLGGAARRAAWVAWDESHFMCSVYRELNVLLLNMLCDPAALLI